MWSTGQKNKLGVSAVIGVILMVAITIAIAAVAYVYVASMTDSSDQGEAYTVCGVLVGINNMNGYNLVFDNVTVEDIRDVSPEDYEFHLELVGERCIFSFLRFAPDSYDPMGRVVYVSARLAL